MGKKMVTCLWAVIFLLLLGIFTTDGMMRAAGVKAVNSVTVRIGSKNVTKKTHTLTVGADAKLKVTVLPAKAVKSVRYVSKNTNTASVNKNGKVTAKQAGTATINITVTGKNNKKVSTWVKVKVTGRQATESSGKNRVLVAYFSATNTTEKIAGYIADGLNADLYEIVPKVPYTTLDLNYNDSSSRTTMEMEDPHSRPAILGSVSDMGKYDVVLIGYPIWHGKAPRIISTFLESYDFSGKMMVPFCTSNSSGIGSSDTDLHSLCPDSVTWKTGKRFAADTSKEEIKSWLDGLSIGDTQNADFVSGFALSKGKNGQAPIVKLNSGYEMPVLGLGTYSLLGDTCVESVVSALQSGYRKIDTAYMYHNEESVGEGVRRSGVPREEVFVTTKLYPSQYANASEAINEALEKLDLGYIDLMLLHHPGSQDVQAYKAMEQAVAEGKIRSIGLSNWYIEEMEEFLPQVTVMPALVQNEIHPYYQEKDVVSYMHSKGIVMEAWYPLGGRGYTAELLGNEVISEIAAAHGKSSAQAILRWDLQNGVVVIPGSSNPEHILENISIFDFELTKEEMEKIGQLDRNEKHDWY